MIPTEILKNLKPLHGQLMRAKEIKHKRKIPTKKIRLTKTQRKHHGGHVGLSRFS